MTLESIRIWRADSRKGIGLIKPKNSDLKCHEIYQTGNQGKENNQNVAWWRKNHQAKSA